MHFDLAGLLECLEAKPREQFSHRLDTVLGVPVLLCRGQYTQAFIVGPGVFSTTDVMLQGYQVRANLKLLSWMVAAAFNAPFNS